MRDGRAGWRSLIGLPPLVVDSVLALLITGLTLWVGVGYPVDGFRAFDTVALALTCLSNLPLAFRRRAPTWALGISGAALVWFLLAGYSPSLNVFGPLLAMYTVAALRPVKVAALAAAYTIGVLLLSGISIRVYHPTFAVAQAVAATAVAWGLGIGTGRLADRNTRLVDLAAQLRREREAVARAAVMAERVRIAAELHDVVAHHMSVISVQAGLARYVLLSDPATASTALDTVADTSHEALTEMRRLLTVLRADEPESLGEDRPYDPAPGLARLDELTERIRSAGVPVEVTVAGPVRQLPPGADMCVYRIIQESLTNVLKHARPALVHVNLVYHVQELVLEVRDDGPGFGSGGAVEGQGIMGMRERAGLYGAALDIESPSDGGFLVRLVMPLGSG